MLGHLASVKKIKGVRLTEAVRPLITKAVMDAQVETYIHKRRAEPMIGAPPKRQCLVDARKKAAVAFNRELNALYTLEGAAACVGMQLDAQTSGPCNCVGCSTRTSVTVPQVRFGKNKRDGFVETSTLYKEYRLVMHKRWARPGETITWPFGYRHG